MEMGDNSCLGRDGHLVLKELVLEEGAGREEGVRKGGE
jgi:hypothetical protein